MKWFGQQRTLGQQATSRETERTPSVKIWLAGLLLFIFGLLLGLIFSFPTATLEKRLLQEVEARAQVKIETGGLALSPLFKLHGKHVVVRPESPVWPPVRIDSFDLSPLWLSLLSANPGARWDGRLLNGQIMVDVYRNGSLNVGADNLMLDLPLQEGSNLRLSGHLTQGQMQSTLPLGKTTKSNLQLVLDKMQLVGLDGLQKNLAMGTVVLQATGRGHSFKITSLEASGGDFALSGRGNFLLGRNLLSSRLNFRIEIRPTQNADPTLVSLLELAARKKADGSHELHLGGTLSKPTLK